MKCRWCNGTGKMYVEPGSSLYYRCGDCQGTGLVQVEDDDEPKSDPAIDDDEGAEDAPANP